MKKQFSAQHCRRIYEEARTYLLTFKDVDQPLLNRYLDEWQENSPESIEDLLEGLLSSASNKQGMPNTIGKVENLKTILCDFNPTKILKEFDSDWKQVFNKIKQEHHPKGNLDINNGKSYWVIFSKAVISGAIFLQKFSNVTEFNDFVRNFYHDEYTRVALPLLLSQEIDGIGFALACDFLKENGYPEFAKPDVHIKKIFNGLGLSDSNDDYEVFKDVIRFSELVNELPYRVDKPFWLVGSGNLYMDGIRILTNRDQFISKVKMDFL